MDQNQNEAVHKPGNIPSETIKKLPEEEKIFAVFEEQKKRLHRMDIYCKNLNQRISQKLVSSLTHLNSYYLGVAIFEDNSFPKDNHCFSNQ